MSNPIIAKTGEDRYCLVKVPEGCDNETIHDQELWLISHAGLSVRKKYCDLPPGNWQIVGIGRELTEAQWKGIVDRQNGSVGKYKDYSITGSLSKYGTYLLGTATESGYSFLRSHGADENYLILKEAK